MDERAPRYEPAIGDAPLPNPTGSRARWLTRVVDALRETSGASVPQHRLLVGAAGTGKSLLLRALARDLSVGDAGFVPMALPAELGEVLSLEGLWSAAARALGDDDGHGSGLARLERAAAGRRIALLIDGADHLLERLDDELWALRGILSARTDLALVGTCRRTPTSTFAHDGAFSDFFAIDRLEPFTPGESAACLEGGPGRLDHDASLVRALHDLCGGVPRRIAELGDALADPETGTDAGALLAAVLDRAEPEHRAALDRLSAQARAVLLALANVREPGPAADVAARLGMPSNKVSAYLNRLGRDGLVEKVPLTGTRSTGYQLVDRTLALACRARCGDAAGVLQLARTVAAAWAHVDSGGDAAGGVELLVHLLGERAAPVVAEHEHAAFLPPELRDVVRALLRVVGGE